MAGRPAPPLRLKRRLLKTLRRRANSQRAPHRAVIRAQMIVLACEGVAVAEIARRVGVAESCVRKWRRRMLQHPRLGALRDRPRRGRPPRVPTPIRCELVKIACERPADQAKAPLEQVWTRELLRATLKEQTGWDLSLSEVTRTLRCGGLRPHRVRMWLHSPDPEFRPKVERICGLYLSPPPGATVVCVDEKTGMQALEHTHPMRLTKAGGFVRREFEYVRHGTSTLLAAFNVRTGEVFGRCRRRTAAGLLRFLEELAARYPRGDVYVIWDNLNVHHGPRWEEFNRRHRLRFHFVYTPKHASWVNQVEVWFSLLARRVLKHASFCGLRELEGAVRAFIKRWNREAHPFRWTFRGDFEPAALRSAA